MYRPFLSYSELGTMLDEGPTKLHDAVSSVLGLDELTAAEKALRAARLARERGVKLVISSDAHSSGALAMKRWGVGVARRAWATRADVLNALPLEQFRGALRRHRSR